MLIEKVLSSVSSHVLGHVMPPDVIDKNMAHTLYCLTVDVFYNLFPLILSNSSIYTCHRLQGNTQHKEKFGRIQMNVKEKKKVLCR